MKINKEIAVILKHHKIDVQAGTLVLLGIYFNLDVDTVCPEEVVKAINLTKIVVKNYDQKIIEWNIPLFEGQNTDWDWVKEWNDGFGKLNPERKDSLVDVQKRMMEFFKNNPKYRMQDVIEARNNYFKSVRDSQFLKSSAKFIMEGIGAMKKSMLLTWCEKLDLKSITSQRGQVVN